MPAERTVTSDGEADKVRVFDRVSRQLVASLDAGKAPDFILVEPVTERVFAFNGTSYDVTVIDARTNQVVTTFKIPGEPEGAQADGKGAIFLAIEDTHLTGEWPVSPCERPTGLAMDRERERLFTVCAHRQMARLHVAAAEFGPKPAATPDNPKPRAAMVPDSFVVLVVRR